MKGNPLRRGSRRRQSEPFLRRDGAARRREMSRLMSSTAASGKGLGNCEDINRLALAPRRENVKSAEPLHGFANPFRSRRYPDDNLSPRRSEIFPA